MSFHSRYFVSQSAKVDGTWADLGGDVKIRVRAFDSPASRELRTKLEEPLKALMQANDGVLPDDKSEELMIAQIAGAVLLDWRGVTEENGTVIPYSVDAGKRILAAYPEFRSEVIATVASRQTWKKQVLDADLGN